MIAFPIAAKTDDAKRDFLWRFVERLRLEHNAQGARVGRDMTLEQFREWKRVDWLPRKKGLLLVLLPRCDQRPVPSIDPLDPVRAAMEAERDARKFAGKKATRWDYHIDLAAVEPLAVKPPPPDPSEDFTTYTKRDPNGKITIDSAAKVSWVQLDLNDDAGVYKDKGVDYFYADFEFFSEVYASAANQQAWVNCLTNSTDNLYDIDIAAGDWIGYSNMPSVGRNYLYEVIDGTIRSSSHPGITTGSLYYDVYDRDEDVGSNGLYGLAAYSDAYHLDLIDSTAMTADEKLDFRYSWAVAVYTMGGASYHTGYIQNLDLQMQSVVPLCMDHYRRLRA